jgi:hypothetical protein
MIFERLFKWMTKEVSNRSGLIATPTALLVDGSQPAPEIRPIPFEVWRKQHGAERLPPKAVAFIAPEPEHRDFHVYVVNVEKQVIEVTIELSREQIGPFAAEYLSQRPTDSRTLLNAPPWFNQKVWSHQIPGRRLVAQPNMAAMMRDGGDGGVGTRVVGDEKKPPQPPRLQALVALAEETSTLQDLPVVVTAEA